MHRALWIANRWIVHRKLGQPDENYKVVLRFLMTAALLRMEKVQQKNNRPYKDPPTP